MTDKKFLYRFLFICVGAMMTISHTTQAQSPYKKTGRIAGAFEPLPFGSVRPGGWLQTQVRENLDGFIGHLDSLVPDLIVDDDIYGSMRLSAGVKSKDVGALGDAGDWQVQFLWWNSETQSNWWDGYIRSAILANDKAHLQRVANYVDRILATQDDDGYLGIYDRELRYNFDNENGELWAKASLLRGLLAWYAHTRDTKVLRAIERAVDNVMLNYPIHRSKPFYSKNPNVGGLSHGLTFTDVLEQLYRINGREDYLDYLLFLYEDFSTHTLNEDAQYAKLMDVNLPLKGHGVHTYEHLRTVAAARYVSGNPALKTALENFLFKVDRLTTATGGPVGDEWTAGMPADATNRGYEYCSLHELLHSYSELFVKSGDFAYGDRVEKLFFNAAQGARHPEESCIAYLKSDNSYYMTGGLNGDSTVAHQTRYKYSPVHQDAAVCCVPNAGRITPYYVEYMWMRKANDIVASLLGPSTVNTVVDGKPVVIEEVTEYPFENRIRFNVKAEGQRFGLWVRKPLWASRFSVSESYREEDGFIVIDRVWPSNGFVEIEFHPEVVERKDVNGEHYFTFGALVLAHPIEAKEFRTKTHPLPGYFDLKYVPGKLAVYPYAGKAPTKHKKELAFTLQVRNPDTGRKEKIRMVPVGETILRQVTFKAE